jgi:hypothetical protein
MRTQVVAHGIVPSRQGLNSRGLACNGVISLLPDLSI